MTMQWFQLVVTLKGSTIPKILPRALMMIAFGAIVVWIHHQYPQQHLAVLSSITSNVVFNLVLGLLLVFRTNTAYDRFWEGRKAWGTIVVHSRNLARLIQTAIVPGDSPSQAHKQYALHYLISFAIATKFKLRDQTPAEISAALEPWLSKEERIRLAQNKHLPLALMSLLSDYLSTALPSTQWQSAQDLQNTLIEGLTACERIHSTPMPPAYTIYLRRLTLLYCLTLPFYVVEDLDWLTPMLMGLVSFILFGVEQIGSEIENPFGYDSNDLPLDAICDEIAANITQISAAPVPSDRAQ
ncbi:MAG: hypothetical protein HC919_01855 [Oscillatoriales cyanobacterium SM2_2_1]|nr:hypothetical protein [Oscillatoriales cyanobacterium SM2_2_1]